jgi:hypothetical protein
MIGTIFERGKRVLKKIVLTVCLLFIISLVFAQSTKKVFISRPKRLDSGAITFKLVVNGKLLAMPNNSYAELEVVADSVTIDFNKRRWIYDYSSALVSRDSATYIVLYPFVQEGFRKEKLIIEKCNSECFENNKKSSKRKIELE